MIRYVLLLLTVLFIHSGTAQTYLGKRLFLNIGTSLAPSFSFFANGNKFARLSYGRSIFPPEAEIEIGSAISSRISISATAAFRGLKNAELRMTESMEGANGFRYTYVDTFKIRTNSLNYGLEFKFHFNHAPMGLYLNFGAGYTRAMATIFPILYQLQKETELGYSDYTELYSEIYYLEPKKVNENFANFTLGIGKSELITRSIYVDYGAKLNIYIHADRFRSSGLPIAGVNNDDYMDLAQPFIRGTIWRTLQTTNLIELHVKIGYSF